MDPDLRAPPNPERLAELVDTLFPGAVVTGVEALRGGLDNGMHVIALRDGENARRVVLRRYGCPEDAPGVRARREAAVLDALAHANVPAPKLLLDDATGSAFGVPSHVISFIDGVPVVDPRGAAEWELQMASVLARVHAVAPPAGIGDLSCRPTSEPGPRFRKHPEGTRLWRAIQAALVSVEPAPRVLLHGDFHAGNVLWREDALVGVVDWDYSGAGDRALDVGYVWMDLALTGERAAADALVRAYGERAPIAEANLRLAKLVALSRPLPDPAIWLPSYLDSGLTHLTADALRSNWTELVHELA